METARHPIQPNSEVLNNQEPAYLKPALSIMDSMRMLELCTPVPTVIITEEHWAHLSHIGVSSRKQVWQEAVYAYSDAYQQSLKKPLSPKLIEYLTGGNDINRITEDADYRLIIVSSARKRTSVTKGLKIENHGRPAYPNIRCYTGLGNKDFNIAPGNYFGYVHEIMNDLYAIQTGVASKLTRATYQNLGYTEDRISQIIDKAIERGHWPEPRYSKIVEPKDEAKAAELKIKNTLLRATFQILFGRDTFTGKPIYEEMGQTVNRIIAGDFRVIQDEKEQGVLANRFANATNYVYGKQGLENPYLTVRQLRLALTEMGVVDPRENVDQLAAQLREMLTMMNCMRTVKAQDKPDMYVSRTPTYSDVLSKDERRIIPLSARPLQKFFCDNGCPLVDACSRDDELWRRDELPSQQELQSSLGVLSEYMLKGIIKFEDANPFETIVIAPDLPFIFSFDKLVEEKRSQSKAKKGLLGGTGKKSNNRNLNPQNLPLLTDGRGHPGLIQEGAVLVDFSSLKKKHETVKIYLEQNDAEAYVDPRYPGQVMVFHRRTGHYEAIPFFG